MSRRAVLVASIVMTTTACGYWNGAATSARAVAPTQWNTALMPARDDAADKGGEGAKPISGTERADETKAIQVKERAVESGKSTTLHRKSCTVDQILIMKNAGLSEAQVKAACED